MEDSRSYNATEDIAQCSNDSFVVPGVSEFAPLQSPNQSPPSWNKGLTKDDMNYIQRKHF